MNAVDFLLHGAPRNKVRSGQRWRGTKEIWCVCLVHAYDMMICGIKCFLWAWSFGEYICFPRSSMIYACILCILCCYDSCRASHQQIDWFGLVWQVVQFFVDFLPVGVCLIFDCLGGLSLRACDFERAYAARYTTVVGAAAPRMVLLRTPSVCVTANKIGVLI